MTQYRMFSDAALSKFREFAAAAQINQRHPQGAFDSKLARDQSSDKDDLIKGLLGVIDDLRRGSVAGDKLSDGELATERLNNAMASIEKRKADSEKEVAGKDEDQPPPFEGRPKRDGGLAADDFAERYPNAVRRPRSTEEVLGSLRKNMSRVGQV